VLAIEPAGDNGGNEELGAIAVSVVVSIVTSIERGLGLRVGTSVGHGKESRLGVKLLEVLVGELLTIDGLATSALYHCELRFRRGG